MSWAGGFSPIQEKPAETNYNINGEKTPQALIRQEVVTIQMCFSGRVTDWEEWVLLTSNKFHECLLAPPCPHYHPPLTFKLKLLNPLRSSQVSSQLRWSLNFLPLTHTSTFRSDFLYIFLQLDKDYWKLFQWYHKYSVGMVTGRMEYLWQHYRHHESGGAGISKCSGPFRAALFPIGQCDIIIIVINHDFLTKPKN